MQGELSEAAIVVADARAQFIEVGERLGDARCTRSLGQILLAQSKYAEAANFLTHARDSLIDYGFEGEAEGCSELLNQCAIGVNGKCHAGGFKLTRGDEKASSDGESHFDEE